MKFVIALDAMGGDFAPDSAIQGSIEALRANPDLKVLLSGPENALRAKMAAAPDVSDRVEYIDAPEVIGMDEPPMLAVRKKVNSSMVQAALAVRSGRAGAMISAGSTGAVLACGMLRIGRIRGIERPALAPALPGVDKPFLLIDCGANVDCQSRYLLQFGLMGSVYMRNVLGLSDPSVGLANIGVEVEKGNKLSKDAHEMMSKQSLYRFIGNVEAREIPFGACDVVVCDGFDGNLLLKYTEGISQALMTMMKRELLSDSRSKLGALLVKPALKRFKDRLDYQKYGGAPLLGVEGAVIKAHGSSSATAIGSAIRQACEMLSGDVVGKIRDGLSAMEPEESAHNTEGSVQS